MALPKFQHTVTKLEQPPPPQFVFDIKACEKHLGDVADEMNKFVGVKNMNPFMWIKENLTPLFDRFKKGERTRELQDAILTLKPEAPIVNPNYVEPKPEELPKFPGLK